MENVDWMERELVHAKRRIRQLMWLVVGTWLLLGFGLAAWVFSPHVATAGSSVAEEVRARKFVLVDDKGTERFRLVADKDGTALRLLDNEGTQRIQLVTTKDSAGLALADNEGNDRVSLLTGKDTTSLRLADEKGTGRAMMSLQSDVSFLSLLDEKGNVKWGKK